LIDAARELTEAPRRDVNPEAKVLASRYRNNAGATNPRRGAGEWVVVVRAQIKRSSVAGDHFTVARLLDQIRHLRYPERNVS
jgi:hypothetical protein